MTVFMVATVLLLGAPSDLPVLGTAPDGALVDHGGKPFHTRDLAGQIWVADFIFTSCHSICPEATQALGKVRKRIADVPGVRFVSFSVDPEFDTPTRLRGFAKANGVALGGKTPWTFVTGKTSLGMRNLAKGFKIAAGPRIATGKGTFDIPHGSHAVLLDRLGRIRGFYKPESAGLANLERDMRRLAGAR